MNQASASDASQAAASSAPVHGEQRAIELVTVFLVAASLLGLALALAERFEAWPVLALAALSTAVWSWAVPVRPAVGRDAAFRLRHALPILLLALVFRAPPDDYVLGGQDEGVYVNIAAHIVQSGGVAVADRELARLGNSAHYLQDNYSIWPDGSRVYVPGVYASKGATPALAFQFYHLFPVWLAMSGGVFGLGAMTWGLTLLSLVSVLFFQRLAVQLTGSARAGMLAGALLALNPLHAFFSRFPLSEIPALAFSLAGCSWFASFALAPAGQRGTRWLAISCAAIACLFLTRVTGFMYLPFVAALALALQLGDQDRRRARSVLAWSLAVFAAYAVSVLYGLAWSRPYAQSAYALSFAPLLGPRWPILLAAAVGFAGLSWARLVHAAQGRSREDVRAQLDRASRWLGPVLLLTVLAGAYKAWQLGFTTHYLSRTAMTQFPGLVANGWGSVARTSLLVAAEYLCPVLLLAFVVLALRRWAEVPMRLLLLFLLGFVAYASVLNWTVAYQPYYARYLASELVPYVLLFLACAWHWLRAGDAGASSTAARVLAACLAVGLVYALLLTSFQFGRHENRGASASIGRLAGMAADGDVIVLEAGSAQGYSAAEVKTTLLYRFGRHVISIGDAGLRDPRYLAQLAAGYDNVWLVRLQPAAPTGFTEVGSMRLHATAFEKGALPPHRLRGGMDTQVFVFRLDAAAFSSSAPVRRFDVATDSRIASEVGQRGAAGMSADGRAGYLLYGPYVAMPAGNYRLQVTGQWSGGVGTAMLDAAMSRGARVLASRTLQSPADAAPLDASLDFHVPQGGAGDLEIRLRVDAGVKASVASYSLHALR